MPRLRTILWTGRFLAAAGLWLALLAGPAWSARADGPDDDYLAISGIIEEGDALKAAGKLTEAHQKYLQAREALGAFRRDNPQWNPMTVNLRIRQLGDKATETLAPVAPRQDSSSPPPTSPAATVKAVAGANPVTLLANGDEPRQVLKLHPQAGDEQELVMTLQMGMDMAGGKPGVPTMAIPPMIIRMGMKVNRVDPVSGEITYDMAIKEFSLGTNSALPAELLAPMRQQFAKMKGIRGTGRVSNSGHMEGFELSGAAKSDPMLAQALGQMQDSLAESIQALPMEPVGAGARWKSKMHVKSQGMTMNQELTTELVKVEGDKLTVNYTLEQSSPNPMMKLTGRGTGKNVLDLGHLAPLSGEMHETVSMEMNMGGQGGAMSMKMTVDVQLQSE